MNHVKRVLFGSLLYWVLGSLVIWYSVAHWPQPANKPGEIAVWLNRPVKIALAAPVDCAKLRSSPGGLAMLSLLVSGMDTGVKAVGCSEATTPELTFLLQRPKPEGDPQMQEDAAWNAIMARPLEAPLQGRSLDYGLRWAGEGPSPVRLPPVPPKMVLQLFPPWSLVAPLLVVYVWTLLVYLARYSALIRDPASIDTPLERRPFSLSKTQMAWWFAIVFAAWIYLWLVKGEVPSVSSQALSLLGISTATTLASSGLSGNTLYSDGQRGEFFLDLLRDASGVAIARFQMLVMTVALGMTFLFDVLTKLTMPVFDASLLTLMGLSAATYVGFKIPEQRDAAQTGDGGPAPGDGKSAYTPTS